MYQIDYFVEPAEGWWFGVVIRALSGVGPSAIPVLAIDQRIDELREEFKRSALPVDYASTHPSPTIVAELDKRPFVKQLRKIQIGPRRGGVCDKGLLPSLRAAVALGA